MSHSPHDPYFGPGYGIPGHPNQYGQYGQYPPPPPASNGPAVAALIANILLTITCCGLLAVPGIVTAAVAMSRVNTDPVSAKNLTNWSWVIFGLAVLVGVVLLVLFFALGLSGELDETGTAPTGDDGIRI
ncbi:hypothetical protein [Actinocorallia populi]|uniref:hypothetical protein n=1 Tax=Actinocorallia populi TaxID=2079200 RepID=UPI0018E54899|nr:hypothetical protein [Actinocorallia populi]